MWQSVLLSTGI